MKIINHKFASSGTLTIAILYLILFLFLFLAMETAGIYVTTFLQEAQVQLKANPLSLLTVYFAIMLGLLYICLWLWSTFYNKFTSKEHKYSPQLKPLYLGLSAGLSSIITYTIAIIIIIPVSMIAIIKPLHWALQDLFKHLTTATAFELFSALMLLLLYFILIATSIFITAIIAAWIWAILYNLFIKKEVSQKKELDRPIYSFVPYAFALSGSLTLALLPEILRLFFTVINYFKGITTPYHLNIINIIVHIIFFFIILLIWAKFYNFLVHRKEQEKY